MNELVVNTSTKQTMTSKEIAKLTGKRHGDVIRDIRTQLSQLDDANLRHEEYQEVTDERGYTKEFTLNKRLTLILTSGYSVVQRAAIIDRWLALEAQQLAAPVVPLIELKEREIAASERLLAIANSCDDAVLKSLALDGLKNFLNGGQKMIGTGNTPFQTADVLNYMGYSESTTRSIAPKIGKILAVHYRLEVGEPMKTKRFIDGLDRSVNCFDRKWFDRAVAIVKSLD